MAKKEFRLSPGSAGWCGENEIIDHFLRWTANAPEEGAPSITVSVRVKVELPDEPEFQTCRDDSPPVDGHVVECKRVIDHPRPHRDHRDPRKATRAWWRGGDDRIH